MWPLRRCDVSSEERWRTIERVYHDALARDPGERSAFVRDACGGDESLRREVDSLLTYAERSTEFMQTQAIDVVARAGFQAQGGATPLVGQIVGPYEIAALLGSGGMGDVYRARDRKLQRDVAIKILPDLFLKDTDRRARFEREARLLAALNHPHIGAIYGFEDRDGVHALVLELVDGQTLAERLHGHPIPVGEALTIARQIAEALAAAHEKGIVHRDLKPANVALTRDGVVKVLDFGLAKASQEATAFGEASDGETIAGLILGTAAYMSPEQARGKAVDSRTDVWAFGCVLWEMLTGRKAFAGATSSDSIAAILARDPDWDLLPADTPPGIAGLLRHCLEKDPMRRLHHMADARIEIDEVIGARSGAGAASVLPRRRRRLALSTVIVAGIVAAILVALLVSRAAAPAAPTRLSVSAPGIISPQLSAAISPDGRRLAFVSTGGSGKLMLWVRALDMLEARVLPGTENAAHPFWSPDGRVLGFLADGKLKKIDAAGGAVETLADSAVRNGPSWGRSGTIVFTSRIGELDAVRADGGPVSNVVPSDLSARRAAWPFFLPDGRHFLFHRQGSTPEDRGIFVASIDSTGITPVTRTEYKAVYSSGYLLFVRDESLFAQRFDPDRLELSGEPRRVADGIWTNASAGQASFSVSENGVLAYVNAHLLDLQLAWFDRSGRRLDSVGQPGRYVGSPALSPDGTRVAIAQGSPLKEHVWLIDANGAGSGRITFGPNRDISPVWSADGRRVAFESAADRGTMFNLKNASGDGDEEPLFTFDRPAALADWSRDGRFLVFTMRGEKSLSDLWVLPLSDNRRPAPFLETAFNKTQAQISPDGRWIAYTSYESGGDEVYVQGFPTPGSKRQVSTAGGVQPRWRSDGKELFYLAPDQRLMAVPVASGAALEIGAAAPLFKTRLIPQGSQSIGLSTRYAVSPDGQRFLCIVPPDDSGPPITVVLNWMAALQ